MKRGDVINPKKTGKPRHGQVVFKTTCARSPGEPCPANRVTGP